VFQWVLQQSRTTRAALAQNELLVACDEATQQEVDDDVSKKKPLCEPSKLFEDCVRDGGSVVAECELCGRTHFGNGRNMEEGELESLQKQAKEHPDKFLGWDYDDIDTGYINGKRVVLGCPCNELSRYEAFIMSHRILILKFLLEYSTARLEESTALASAAKAATESIEKLGEAFNRPAPKRRKFNFTQGGKT